MPPQRRGTRPMQRAPPRQEQHTPKKGSFFSSLKKRINRNQKRVSTGIPTLDKMCEGGYEEKSINITVGGIGSGKSIFGMHFLMQGVKEGEKVMYVTFEEKREEFFQNMIDFGWDLEKEEEKGNFVFLEYSPEKVRMMIDEGGGAIESLVIRHKVTRIVIDSITSFTLLYEKEVERRQAVMGFFDIIRKWNCTSLLIVQEHSSTRKERGTSHEELEADSIMLLYYANINNERKRFLEILKMRGTNHAKDLKEFTISDKGVQIGQKANIEEVLNY